jgi:peptidylprolyl isomerase
MATVAKGNFVQVDYTGSLEDDTVFDTSEGRQPLEFQVGQGQMIPGFDQAVLGMAIEEEKQVTLTADQAYGQPREELKREFPVSMISQEEVKMGQELWFETPHGPVRGLLLHKDEEKIIVDFNHPLAGQALKFQIKVVGISDQPTQVQSSCSCGCTSTSCSPSSDCGSGCG